MLQATMPQGQGNRHCDFFTYQHKNAARDEINGGRSILTHDRAATRRNTANDHHHIAQHSSSPAR